MCCILGAHVNVRSSILGDGGRAKEVQSEFRLTFFLGRYQAARPGQERAMLPAGGRQGKRET